jgi:hypothetical protein
MHRNSRVMMVSALRVALLLEVSRALAVLQEQQQQQQQQQEQELWSTHQTKTALPVGKQRHWVCTAALKAAVSGGAAAGPAGAVDICRTWCLKASRYMWTSQSRYICCCYPYLNKAWRNALGLCQTAHTPIIIGKY